MDKEKSDDKILTYNLDVKEIWLRILFLFIYMLIVGGVCCALACLSLAEQLRYIGIMYMVAPCSFLLPNIAAIILIIKSIRILIYNRKALLTITENKIACNSLSNKNIIIEKSNIDKLTVASSSGIFGSELYLSIKLKEPIHNRATSRKLNIFKSKRIKNHPKYIEINLTILLGNKSEIIYDIHNILNVEIDMSKKLKNDLKITF